MRPSTSSAPIAMRRALPRQRRADAHRLGQLEHAEGARPADEGHQAPGDAGADAAPPRPVHRPDRGDALHRDVRAAEQAHPHRHSPLADLGVGCPDASGTRKGSAQRLRRSGKVVTGRPRLRRGGGAIIDQGDRRRAARCASWYGSDRGLTTRMALTIFGLGLVYVLFIGALIAAGVGAVTVLVIAGVFAVAQLLFGDKLALRSMRARVTSPRRQPELHAMIERLCQLADLPKPRVAVVRDGPAERVRRGPQPQDRDGLRDDRPDGAPGAARAGGRDRARAVPHREQGRDRDDRRRVPRDGRRPVRALRDLQRHGRRARARQQRRDLLPS